MHRIAFSSTFHVKRNAEKLLIGTSVSILPLNGRVLGFREFGSTLFLSVVHLAAHRHKFATDQLVWKLGNSIRDT